LLYWRTRHIAIGTEYTTVAIFGFKQHMAAFAFIEPLASIGRHGFFFTMATTRTGNGRFSHHGHSPSAESRPDNSDLTGFWIRRHTDLLLSVVRQKLLSLPLCHSPMQYGTQTRKYQNNGRVSLRDRIGMPASWLSGSYRMLKNNRLYNPDVNKKHNRFRLYFDYPGTEPAATSSVCSPGNIVDHMPGILPVPACHPNGLHPSYNSKTLCALLFRLVF